ncbi:ribosomal RNA large subunit methyltransferase H [Candidatus Moduliflexus flocculans]|uniref:Ribosomal RNA large subunit methyltransferase H n=1 Tax=Candidatus Moduliflexus flocculans TaxID=1499966 RepID=A0A0S6W427_9BACT|nr:ribosomal RNA large subunit methyltransferase H [Candidatus Moduliflexus flocculans]
MIIKLVCVGKIKELYLLPGIEEYLERIRHYTPVEYVEIKAETRKKHEPDALIKQREADKIRQTLMSNDCVIALDEHGKEFSSEQFAGMLSRYQQRGDVKRLAFVTGGATGLAEEFLHRADMMLALSKMTFPHQLCRLILLEQVYRGLTILAGESYHKS